MASKKTILVTGGNAGIGFALCTVLARDHGCKVYLGSRDHTKGALAVAQILEAVKGADVELVVIDVTSEESVVLAADRVKTCLKNTGGELYAVCNNAGVGLNQPGAPGTIEGILKTNYEGPKLVSDAFEPIIKDGGRIVNMSSGVASMFLRSQDAATKQLYSDPDLTLEALDADVAKQAAAGNGGMGSGYGLSKCALTALTLVQAKRWPRLACVSITPGFIDTAMTKGFGARLSPEQGTVSAVKALLGDVVSGHYYGSDGLRSPLTCTRDPGTPEYQGEPNPDASKYNK